MNTADRRERVAQLVAKGWSSARLAEHFGVTQRTINYDCRELGITQEKPPPADTVERRESVAKLTRQGVSVREIADRLKISTRTVERDRAATGVAPVTPRWTDDEHQRALRLLADGASLAEVSRTLSRSYDRTYRRYKGMGWTSAQTGAHNSLRTKLGKLLDD